MSKEEIPTVNFLVESNSLNRVATKLKELGILESEPTSNATGSDRFNAETD